MEKIILTLLYTALIAIAAASCSNVHPSNGYQSAGLSYSHEETYHCDTDNTEFELVDNAQTDEAEAVNSDVEQEYTTLTAEQQERAWRRFCDTFKNAHLGLISVQNDFCPLETRAVWLTEYLGIPIAPSDFVANIIYFDFLDFITLEQLEIAREYLGIADGEFDDQLIFAYLLHSMTVPVLREYDAIPFEDMADNPRRILVRMLESYYVASFIHARETVYANTGSYDYFYANFQIPVGEFGRIVFDFREQQ